MTKFSCAAIMALALITSDGFAQGYQTNCTRNYFGDVTCTTNPTGGPGYVDLLGYQRGADLANTQNQNDFLQQQNMIMQQRLMQQQLEQLRFQHLLRCQQAPVEQRAAMGCY